MIHSSQLFQGPTKWHTFDNTGNNPAAVTVIWCTHQRRGGSTTAQHWLPVTIIGKKKNPSSQQSGWCTKSSWTRRQITHSTSTWETLPCYCWSLGKIAEISPRVCLVNITVQQKTWQYDSPSSFCCLFVFFKKAILSCLQYVHLLYTIYILLFHTKLSSFGRKTEMLLSLFHRWHKEPCAAGSCLL